ncbi:unnamed protein product [Colias eurytheme]|nr:unnamed protein product [Colias eurytheme]
MPGRQGAVPRGGARTYALAAPQPPRRARAEPANSQYGYFVTALYWPDFFAASPPTRGRPTELAPQRPAIELKVSGGGVGLILINCESDRRR